MLQPTDERQTRIARIVGEVLDERRRGRRVDLQSVARKYPELMPDLAIRFAAIQAHEQSETPTNGHDAKLKFIRDELVDMEEVECVDRGAQGAVYKAVHRPTRREVAIKILLGGAAATEEQRHRFHREVQLVARLRHPHIVRIYDSGEIKGCSYIVMEFIQGLRIDDYVCVEQLSVPQVVRLFCKVCDAVHTAHQFGVLHRDLKPSNILIDEDGEPRVLDFGLAKDMDAPRGPSMLSLSGQVVGTIPYLSPERVKRNESSTSSDLYALGIILYELLTGAYPYAITDDNFETLSNIVQQEPASPRKVLAGQSSEAIKWTDINGDLERVILKALAKEPERRYSSVADFAGDLQRYLAGDGVMARSESRIYVLRKTVKRYRILIATGCLCVIFLAAGLVSAMAAWRRSDQVAKVAMAGLEMSSLLKLGSVQRDAGRIDDAIHLFEKVIEVAGTAGTEDALVLRQLSNAHHRLAGLQIEKKNLDRAALHAKKTFDLAQKLVTREPDNLEFQSVLGFAWNVRGQVALERQAYEKALEDLAQAATIQRTILAAHPDDPSLAGDLAHTLELQGSCARHLRRTDEAAQKYTEAYEIFRRFAEADPQNLTRSLDLLWAESRLAVLHLSFKLPQHDAQAKRWLQTSEQHLLEIKKRDDAALRQDSIDKLNYEISSNKALLQRRLAASTENS